MWTKPELTPPLLTTTLHQRMDVSALDRFSVHHCLTRRVFSGTGLELVTRQASHDPVPIPLGYRGHSTSFNSPLLTCRVHGFKRLSPYPYTSISSIQSETRLARPGNVFLVVYSPMSVLTGPGEV
ncbi:hypothetical protein TNCV_4221951 [Trichonephila clavipes]|nr:hypothetical protein TNCV_4221951 [Trichonephila clavipes]